MTLFVVVGAMAFDGQKKCSVGKCQDVGVDISHALAISLSRVHYGKSTVVLKE